MLVQRVEPGIIAKCSAYCVLLKEAEMTPPSLPKLLAEKT